MNYTEIVINGIIETKNAQNDYNVFIKYIIRNYEIANKEYQTLDSFFNGCLNVYDEMIRDIENQFFESQKDLKGMIKDIKDDLKNKKYPDELHKKAKEIELNSATKQLESLNYDEFSFLLPHYTNNKYRVKLKMDAIVYLKTRTIELYETLKKQIKMKNIPEKTKKLFTFIDYLHSNIDEFLKYKHLFDERKEVFNKITIESESKNYILEIDRDEVISNLKKKRDEIDGLKQQYIDRPIELKIIELNLCDTTDLSTINNSIYNWYNGEPRLIKENYKPSDKQTYLEYKNKCIDIRAIPFSPFNGYFRENFFEIMGLIFEKFLTSDEKYKYFPRLLPKETPQPTTPPKPQQSSKNEEETNIPILTTIDSIKPEPRFNFTETQINGLHYNLTNERKCITTIENFKAICKGAKEFDKIEWIGSLQKLNAFCRWLTDNRDKNPVKGFVNEFFKIKGKAKIKLSTPHKSDNMTLKRYCIQYDDILKEN